MATQEALNTVDNLKETSKWSLDEKEKNLLNSLTKTDIDWKRQTLEDKKFKIDGKWDVLLSKIIEDMVISADREKSTLYWKPIARGSELWAAIQLYIILHNKSVGTPKIDWKVGKYTNEGIADTQTALQAGGNRNREVISNWEKVWINDIDDKTFTKYFNNLGAGTADKYKKLWVLKNGWQLNIVLDSNNQPLTVHMHWANCLYVKTNHGQVAVPFKMDWNDMVDLQDLSKAIIEAVDQNEAIRLANKNYEKVKAWIDNFDENNITDALIKRFTTDKKLNFTCEKKNNGKLIIKAVSTERRNKWKVLYTSSEIASTSMLDNNWNFDQTNFQTQLDTSFRKKAAEHVNKVYMDKLNDNVILASASSDPNELKRNIDLCSTYLTEENALSSKTDLNSSKTAITTRKTDLINKREYVTDSNTLTNIITKFETAGKGQRAWNEIKAKVDVLKTYMNVTTTVDSDWIITNITLSPKTSNTDGFKTDQQMKEYNDAVANMKKTLREINPSLTVDTKALSAPQANQQRNYYDRRISRHY